MGHGALAGVGFSATIVLVLMIPLAICAYRLRGTGIWVTELHHETISKSPNELDGTALSRFQLNGSSQATETDYNSPVLAVTSSFGGAPSRLREAHLAESASTARDSDVFPMVLQAYLREYVAIAYEFPLSPSSQRT